MTPSDDHPAPQAYVLSFRCPDRLGVVERYSGVLYGCGAYITEVSNYTDPATAMFFLRCVFDDRVMTVPPAEFGERLKVLAEELGMEYTLRPADEKPRAVLAVSRFDHCLSALLTKWRSGPIIAQEVRAIDHAISVEQMVHLGHDTEATALSHAVRLFCEQRVLLNGQRTVIL